MVCCDLVIWVVIVIVLYLVVSYVVSRLRIDRYTDVYVLITGCDSGFGNEAARRFDRMGCHVFAGCLTEKGRESLKEECSDRLHAISLDVAKIESIREAYDYVKANLPKGQGLWGVVNNAGVGGKLGPPEWSGVADYRKCLDVNFYGVVNVTMTFLPLIKKARGRIVNTASISGRVSTPINVPYCLSKYVVEAFTDGLRRSLLPYGVKAVLVEPGVHKTPMTTEQSQRAQFIAAWDGASPAAKEEYGEGFRNELIAHNWKIVNLLASETMSGVVDAYEQGLLGRFPRARYPVGKDCYLFYLPLTILPEWLGDWIMNNFGNPPKMPVRK